MINTSNFNPYGNIRPTTTSKLRVETGVIAPVSTRSSESERLATGFGAAFCGEAFERRLG